DEDGLHHADEERDFFGEVKQVISLAQPFSDFIHQFEADKPLLSQVLPAWTDLVKHTKAWCASVDEKLSTGVLEVVEYRFQWNYNCAWPAALLVDPIYVEKLPGGWVLPFKMLSEE
ncbi:hypothetical protein V8C86DRAFT_1768852, partial [Haematococcus lacustris]